MVDSSYIVRQLEAQIDNNLYQSYTVYSRYFGPHYAPCTCYAEGDTPRTIIYGMEVCLMDKHSALQVTTELIQTLKTCCLSTINTEGFPETRAMLNLRNGELYPGLRPFFAEQVDTLVIYFSTNTSSAKVAHVRECSRACVYFVNPDSFSGAMLQGPIQVVDDFSLRERLWQPGWEQYYRLGPQDPDHTILRLEPLTLEVYADMDGCKLNLKQD